MNNVTTSMHSENHTNRRHFLKTASAIGAGIAFSSFPKLGAQSNKNSRLRILQIGVGGIGSLERGQLKNHKMVEFSGFCDVDQELLDQVGSQFPGAFRMNDYREVFADHADRFDAVIVETPDFNHAPIMLTALKHHKHVYGQKPLVHQLDELRMIRAGLKARPGLVTQMGNQRACHTGRMQSVEMLKNNQLGRPVEAYVWTGGVERGHYFADPWMDYPASKPVPSFMHWDLWKGPLKSDIPYHEDLAPRRWRTFWETGGGQLADWGCHLLDLLFFAYDLKAPEAVMTHCVRPPAAAHTSHNISTLTFPGGSGFAKDKFVVQYSDSSQQPSFAALGLPPMRVGANHTMVVCEEGTLLLQADGKITVFRKGKVVENEPLPEVAPRHHWHDWVDTILGSPKPLWAPFEIGSRITEPALLAVKATRFPGQELLWDGKNFRFTNHDQANKEIVSREYKEGFAPPTVA